jgi:hypothetical protein
MLRVFDIIETYAKMAGLDLPAQQIRLIEEELIGRLKLRSYDIIRACGRVVLSGQDFTLKNILFALPDAWPRPEEALAAVLHADSFPLLATEIADMYGALGKDQEQEQVFCASYEKLVLKAWANGEVRAKWVSKSEWDKKAESGPQAQEHTSEASGQNEITLPVSDLIIHYAKLAGQELTSSQARLFEDELVKRFRLKLDDIRIALASIAYSGRAMNMRNILFSIPNAWPEPTEALGMLWYARRVPSLVVQAMKPYGTQDEEHVRKAFLVAYDKLVVGAWMDGEVYAKWITRDELFEQLTQQAEAQK